MCSWPLQIGFDGKQWLVLMNRTQSVTAEFALGNASSNFFGGPD